MSSKDYLNIAMEHHDEVNYSQAIVAVDKYLEIEPDSKSGKLLKACIYRDLANFKVVLEILDEIKPFSENDKEFCKLFYLEMGETLCALGKHEEALRWYDKRIKLCPDETVGYIYKGSCLAKSGEFELAKSEHLKATELQGDPEEAYYNLALIYRAQMNFEKAKLYCEKSLEIDPDDESVIHCYEDIIEAIKLKATG